MSMKKLIITYHGDVETTSFFMTQIESQLQADGYQVYPLFYDAVPAELSSDIAAYLQRSPEQAEKDLEGAVFLTFNFAGCYSKDPCLYKDGMLVDRYRMRIVNILVDHPYHYHDFLYEQIKERRDRYLQFDLDRQHIAYMERYFPEISLGGCLPSGGTAYKEDAGEDTADTDERPVDILFAGTYVPPEGFDLFIERNGPEYSAFYHSMLREALADPSAKLEDIIRRRLIEEIEEGVSEDEIRQTLGHVQFLDYFVRYKRRGEVIRYLADWEPYGDSEDREMPDDTDGEGLHITIVGSGWEHLMEQIRHPERITLLPYADSKEVLQLLTKTKISLNVLPSFHAGAHDRIWNSMLCDAVCVTDTNDYLNAFLQDGENAIVFQTPAIDDDILQTGDDLEESSLRSDEADDPGDGFVQEGDTAGRHRYRLTAEGEKEMARLARRIRDLLRPEAEDERGRITRAGEKLAASQTWAHRTKGLEKVLDALI